MEQENLINREKHLDSIFEYGYNAGLDPFCKPHSNWLMKKYLHYDKKERKAYNLGYKRGFKVFDKINTNN